MDKYDRYVFEAICRMNQKDLKRFVGGTLVKTHGLENVICEDGYVFAQGEFPVLLVAHLDTVHKALPTSIKYDKAKKALYSKNGIGGDDRCGVYMILKIVQKYNCSVLFCEDEEIGGIGATKFAKSKIADELQFNYIMEFDRKGSDDAVFYDCDNPDFEKFITKEFFKTSYGSFSDISIVAPSLGCAAVNLSCGYYRAHTVEEYVVLEEMERSILEACKILDRTTEEDKFEYIEVERYYRDRNGRYYGYGWNDDGDADNYYMFEFEDGDGRTQWDEVWANSEEEAVGRFCMSNPDIPFEKVICVYKEEDIYTR